MLRQHRLLCNVALHGFESALTSVSTRFRIAVIRYADEEVIRRHKDAPRPALVRVLNPKIRGWAQYYNACVAKETFDWMDEQVFHKPYRWACFRHPRKTGGWSVRRYWKRKGERLNFGDGKAWLAKYADTPIKRHVKVRGDKSPYDGNWPYWVQRLGRDPMKPARVVNLLKRQERRCGLCRLYFGAEDVIEMHHWERSPHRPQLSPQMNGTCLIRLRR